MALVNVLVFVVDDETACEDLLVGLVVLHHLDIDFRTLLEQKWTKPDGTDCASIEGTFEKGPVGRLGRLMMSRLKIEDASATPNHDPHCPQENYNDVQAQDDPFPDHFVLQPDVWKEETDSSRVAVKAMMDRAKHNGFPDVHWASFESIVLKNVTIFQTSFSNKPLKVESLRI